MLAASMKDGDVQTTRQRAISGDFGLNLIVLLGLRAPYEVELAGSGSNQREKVQVAGLRHDEQIKISKTLHDEESKEFADLKFLEDGQIAHLTYSSFGTTVEEGQTFMKRAFETIQSKGSKALILDLRGNGGGEDQLGKLLFSYLVDAPFIYYEDLIATKMSFSFAKYTDPHRDLIVPAGVAELRPDGRVHMLKYENLGLQQPNKPTFTGPVYILINGGCLSTTAEFLTEVHVHHRATFIGEESAGCYYGSTSGEVVRITLPNTKLGIYIPLVSYYMAVGGSHEHDAARGIIPDYPVERSIADLLARVDRDFDLALELARKR
jgi:C-terminal processing protease CtpA/Prc